MEEPGMKISKKTEYALRAVVAMARDSSGRTFSIQEIATSEQIPLKFLEQILLVLKNSSILRSKRGVGGGYQLTRPPQHIHLAEIIEAIEGQAEPLPCSGFGAAPRACECGAMGPCALGTTLAKLRDDIHQWLRDVSIADVIEREQPTTMGSFEI
jgi:Rrf2 family transcriptional regulator, iron-sulfur cluster assembly transcription factor